MSHRNFPVENEKYFLDNCVFGKIGEYLFKQEHFLNSLTYFDKAIANNPDDVRVLLQRSECRARLCLFKQAINDIKHAVSLYPENIGALVQKAFVSYLCCQFEESIVEISKVLHIQNKADRFQQETRACYDAVNNCLLDCAGHPLRDHYSIIRQLAWEKNKKILKGTDAVKKHKLTPFFKCDDKEIVAVTKKIHTPASNKFTDEYRISKCRREGVKSIIDALPFKPLQSYTTNLDNYMGEKYLDGMVKDKIFLKNLPNCSGINGPNEKCTEKIAEITKRTYNMISHQQEVLRARRPFYSIKYVEAVAEKNINPKMEQHYHRRATEKEAELIYAKLIKTAELQNFQATLNLVEKFQVFCESKPKRLLPNKDEYIKAIAQIVCNAYYDIKRINPRQYPWDQVKRINKFFGLPVSREPSSDSVMGQIGQVFVDVTKKIKYFENHLKESENSNQVCWYIYELCRYNIDIRNFDLAKIYGKQCIAESMQSNNLKWTINAYILLAKLAILQRNKADALSNINMAQDIAVKLNDATLQEYLKRCHEVFNNLEFDDFLGIKMLEKRQKKILNVMTHYNLKSEFENLFNAMATVPTNRRMSVMPGIRILPKEISKKKNTRFSAFK